MSNNAKRNSDRTPHMSRHVGGRLKHSRHGRTVGARLKRETVVLDLDALARELATSKTLNNV